MGSRNRNSSSSNGRSGRHRYDGVSERGTRPPDPRAQMALDAVKLMDAAGIGHRTKWDKIARKVHSGTPLSPAETEYYTRLTRIYRNPAAGSRTGRNYHVELSELDPKPACAECGGRSRHYCHINDAYLCDVHVVGHDPNE